MQFKSIAECSKGSILQHFGPLFSYHLSLRSLFGLFLSGNFTQVLLNLEIIYRLFFFQLTSHYMVLTRDDALKTVSTRLLYDILPGLEAAGIFQDNVSCI